jgi:hypothetical protein
MRRGERSGAIHAREALADHLAIKPRAGEPRAPALNAAHRRLQLAPSDPRWALSESDWRFIPHPAGSGLCWFCALPVGGDSLFSAPLRMYAHTACNGAT